MDNGLKKCPFCGSEQAKVVDKLDILGGVSTKYYVRCSDCGAQTKEVASRYEAIEIWNKRAE